MRNVWCVDINNFFLSTDIPVRFQVACEIRFNFLIRYLLQRL